MAALLAGLTAAVCSCSKSDECSDGDDESVVMNDLEFVRNRLIIHNADGSFNGLVFGVFIDESRPATAFVGVEDLEEAMILWENLVPYDAHPVVEGDNRKVTLTDEDGNEQGRMFFNVLDNGTELAQIRFSSTNLIDEHLNSIIFIPSSLWPHNSYETFIPLPEVISHKKTGETFVLISYPSMGSPGYYMHIGEKRYFTKHQYGKEYYENSKNIFNTFPSLLSLNSIAKKLKEDDATCEMLEKVFSDVVTDIRTSRFFTSWNYQKSKYYICNFSTITFVIQEPLPDSWSGEKDGYNNHTSKVYVVTFGDDIPCLKMDSSIGELAKLDDFDIVKGPNSD